MSSGATLNGSPASGGYAGAKATQRFVAAYAQEESRRAGLDLTVTAVMPTMTPFGDVGRSGVQAYAARSGQTEDAFLEQLGELLTPEIAGSALVDLVRADAATIAPEYVLTAAGLQPLRYAGVCRPGRPGHGEVGRARPAAIRCSIIAIWSAGMPGPGRTSTSAGSSTRPHVSHTTSRPTVEPHPVWR